MLSLLILVLSLGSLTVKSQFYECDFDPGYTAPAGPLEDMQFTWLGILQYIHIKTGHPHYFRTPRVILVSRQFALSTAVDAAELPDNYALGNVAFSDYERDDKECGVIDNNLAEENDCDPAVLVMPIADVLLHPEYKHFGIKNSVALLKLIVAVKSKYMLPACLPFTNWLVKHGQQTTEMITHVDFIADTPRDYSEEEKEIKKLSLLAKELCYLYDPRSPQNLTRMTWNRMLCTTGCGFHSGAPTVVHEHTGHWALVAIATGGSPCPDPLRMRRPSPPSQHIAIYPYVSWITAAITGKAVGVFAKDDPFGFVMRSTTSSWPAVWLGHWWMGGLRCFDRGDDAIDLFKFYHEIFSVKPTTKTLVTYNLEIRAPPSTTIICVKVGMPWRLGHPIVEDLDTPIAKVTIPMIKVKTLYKFQIEAWGYNITAYSKTSFDTSSQEFGGNPGSPNRHRLHMDSSTY